MDLKLNSTRNLNLDLNLNVDLNLTLDLNLECDKELKLKTETGAVLDDDHNGGPSTMTFGNDIESCVQHKSAAAPAALHARNACRRARAHTNKRSIIGICRSGC